jgi:cbb3-type cytochrome oxidase subunit 3
MITGFFTALLIVCFCAIVGWAYSSRRKSEFEAIASMPLLDDVDNHRETHP